MKAGCPLRDLEGDDAFFGGQGQVYGMTRAGFAEKGPNKARMTRTMTFTSPLENEMMDLILTEGMGLDDGVTTVEGKDGRPAVREALGL